MLHLERGSSMCVLSRDYVQTEHNRLPRRSQRDTVLSLYRTVMLSQHKYIHHDILDT